MSNLGASLTRRDPVQRWAVASGVAAGSVVSLLRATTVAVLA